MTNHNTTKTKGKQTHTSTRFLKRPNVAVKIPRSEKIIEVFREMNNEKYLLPTDVQENIDKSRHKNYNNAIYRLYRPHINKVRPEFQTPPTSPRTNNHSNNQSKGTNVSRKSQEQAEIAQGAKIDNNPNSHFGYT
ncbi:hypothetical protein CHS0354_026926, partial [Potamilus streckersoni]